jgi:hypothetical protein
MFVFLVEIKISSSHADTLCSTTGESMLKCFINVKQEFVEN